MCEIVTMPAEELRGMGPAGITAVHGRTVGPWPSDEVGESVVVPDESFVLDYALLCRHMLPESDADGNWWGEWERLTVRPYEGVRFDPRDTQFRFLAR